jgi:hypothetical protein
MEIHVVDVGINAPCPTSPQLLALAALCPVPIGQDVGRAPQSVSSQWKRPVSARNRFLVLSHSLPINPIEPEFYLNIVTCWVYNATNNFTPY